MSNKTEIEQIISTFMRAATFIAFFADIIAIILFISGIFDGRISVDHIMKLGFIIILVFTLSILLSNYSNSNFSGFFVILGIIYAILSEVILYITATRNLLSFGEISLYIISGIVVSIFASIMLQKSDIGKQLAIIPYIIGSLLLIITLIFGAMGGGEIKISIIFILMVKLGIIQMLWVNEEKI